MTDVEIKQKKEKKVMTPERLEQLARARKKAQEIKAAGALLKMEAKIANITKIDETETELPNKETELPNKETDKKETKKTTHFKPTPTKEIENKIVKAELVANPVNQEYVPEYSPRVDVQPPRLEARAPQRVWEEEEEDWEEDGGRPIREEASSKRQPRKEASARRQPRIKTKIVIEQSSDDEDEFHPHEHVIFVKRKSKNDSVKKVIPAATPTPPNTPEERVRDAHAPPYQTHRQLPTIPLENTMDDFVNAGFTNYRKYY